MSRGRHATAALALLLLVAAACEGSDDGLGAHSTAPPAGLPGMAVTPAFGLVNPKAIGLSGATVLDRGRLLALFYVGGTPNCYGLARVAIERRGRSIVATIYEGGIPPADRICTRIGILKVAAVRFDEPLRRERIVDGATGERVALISVTPQMSQLRLRNGRLPHVEATPDRWSCPTGPFVRVDRGQVFQAAEVLLEALNSPMPKPSEAWPILEGGFRTMYRGPQTFARLVRHQPYLPDFGRWRISTPERLATPDTVGALDPIREVCLRAAFAASWTIRILFPRFEGLAHASPSLYFIGRPSGPKLWLVE